MSSEPHAPPGVLTQPPSAPRRPPSYSFALLFLVWLLIFTTATLVTLILPESYMSEARIKISRDQPDVQGLTERPVANPSHDPYFNQTELESIKSQVILDKVIEALDLNTRWGQKYAGDQKLRTSESRLLLKRNMDLIPIINTSFIRIRVYDENKQEAAEIANKVAEVYYQYRQDRQRESSLAAIKVLQERLDIQDRKIQTAHQEVEALRKENENGWRLEEAKRTLDDLQRVSQTLSMKIAFEKVDMELPKTTMVEIMDRAEPGLRPVKPNKSLNITVGLVLGGVCGSLLSTILYVLQRIAYRRASGRSRTQWPPRVRAVVHFLIALVVGLVVGYNCASPLDLRSLIAIPIALVLGGCASAWIEFAHAGAAPVPRKTELTLPGKY